MIQTKRTPGKRAFRARTVSMVYCAPIRVSTSETIMSGPRARIEGLPHCDWVLIDAGDLIVHLFRPEVRQFYNIEKIWAVDSPHRTQAN